MYAAYRHEHAMSRSSGGQPAEFIQGKAPCKIPVMAVNREEDENQEWNQNQDHPRAFHEFRDRKYHHHNRRTYGTKTIDNHLGFPALVKPEPGALLHNFLTSLELSHLPPSP